MKVKRTSGGSAYVTVILLKDIPRGESRIRKAGSEMNVSIDYAREMVDDGLAEIKGDYNIVVGNKLLNNEEEE